MNPPRPIAFLIPLRLFTKFKTLVYVYRDFIFNFTLSFRFFIWQGLAQYPSKCLAFHFSCRCLVPVAYCPGNHTYLKYPRLGLEPVRCYDKMNSLIWNDKEC